MSKSTREDIKPLTLGDLETPTKPSRPGRPSPKSLGEIEKTKGYRLALSVNERVSRGEKRALVIEAVAKENFVSTATVRQALKENQKQVTAAQAAGLARQVGVLNASVERDYNECIRRMSGIPDDVRESLAPIPMQQLLQTLRHLDIDGTCPRWVVESVRGTRHLGPEAAAAIFLKAATHPQRDEWLASIVSRAKDHP